MKGSQTTNGTNENELNKAIIQEHELTIKNLEDSVGHYMQINN
jgi:hypothetical protein